MTKYIKGKDGKFAGSIGDGKTNIPTAAPKVSKAEQKRLDSNAKIRELNEKRAANAEAYARLREQQETSRQAWFTASRILSESMPQARWMLLDDDFELAGVANSNKEKFATGETVLALHPEIAEQLAQAKNYSQIRDGQYKQATGGHRVGIFFKCGEDGCEHLYYPEGFQPSHKASPYCRSGRRNHCTCDTCF